MDPKPQCYIPRPKVIGPLVHEKKIFEGFLPHMGVAAILVMWPRCPEETFFPLTHGRSTWNLALIGPAVLEKIFENGGQTMEHACTNIAESGQSSCTPGRSHQRYVETICRSKFIIFANLLIGLTDYQLLESSKTTAWNIVKIHAHFWNFLL